MGKYATPRVECVRGGKSFGGDPKTETKREEESSNWNVEVIEVEPSKHADQSGAPFF